MEREWGKDLHLGFGERKKNDEATTSLCLDVNTDQCDRLSNEANDFDSKLQSKHKIFLSHSGAQKDFVEGLCEDLENCYHFPFFDKRPSSLPKGERFPELIFKAAEQCEMAIVVISEEYFTSKWPMIELNIFIKEKLGSKSQLKILPLFFGMSICEFGNPLRQAQWFTKWNNWAKDDTRIKPMEFKNAIKVLRSFNGIEFNQDIMDVSTYKRLILSSICSTISADLKWDDSHVQGRSNLYEAICEKIKIIEPSQRNGICIFGFYGIGGIGKTTMCKTLCNKLSKDFSKVCHVELKANRSSEELLKGALKKLTNNSEEFLQRLNEGECRNILLKESAWREKIFLALDNVWDDSKSIEEAKMFLEAAFCKGSIVMVTSRSLKTLTYLGISKSHCYEVPELGETDAKKLFLYHAAKGKQVFGREEDYNNIVKECIARCCFRKSAKQGTSHFLPLALKVLGMHLGCFGTNPSDWLENLPKVRDFNMFPEENPVFSIIRVNFDRLSMQEQALFMDTALFIPRSQDCYDVEDHMLRWLSLIHRQKMEDTQTQVMRLKEKGLLEDVDFKSHEVSMHDLYHEFANMEAQGKLNSDSSLTRRRWALYLGGTYPSEMEMTPSGRCWENLIRVSIEEKRGDAGIMLISSLQGIQWRYCSNVMVLKLIGLTRLKGVLNLKDLTCLRSLEFADLDELDGLEGLEGLNNLLYFQWFGEREDFESHNKPHLGQLPASLKVLHLTGVGVHLKRDVFARCSNLCKMTLCLIQAGDGDMDFSQCKTLRAVELRQIQGVQKLSGLGSASCLESLDIFGCEDLSDVSGLDHLVSLQHLDLYENSRMETLPDLQKLTNLQVLRIQSMGVAEVRGVGILQRLRELSCSGLDFTQLPDLNGLLHLQYLDLSRCPRLTIVEGVGTLLALQHLDLKECTSLERLPDLSMLANLKELDIAGSAIALHEEDIHMLAKLPMLRPIVVDYWNLVSLDVVRRKVLKCKGLDGAVKEVRDMEMPPIMVRSYEF